MTEYERGYRDALEAAALIVQTAPVQIDGSTTGPMQNLASAILGTFRPGIAAAIRALPIPPAPDDETLVEVVCRVMARQIGDAEKAKIMAKHQCTEREMIERGWSAFTDEALEILSALREAGARR